MFRLSTPVVLISFNRPETTKQVFETIRKYSPQKLYLVSDGARDSKPGEEATVAELREYLESAVDWDCEVIKVYSTENQGCALRVSTALDTVFENEEMAIILEDDCVPNDSFFEFCQTMLLSYKDDSRVASISGSTEIEYTPIGDKDYYFSKVFGCCGWATWRRAWNMFDYNMTNFYSEKNDPIFKRTLFLKKAYWGLMAQFKSLAILKKKYSWAYIFYYYSILHDCYHIYPKYNLIKNIGFDEDATHTGNKPDHYLIETKEMNFPIRIQNGIEREWEFDKMTYRIVNRYGLIIRIKQLLGIDINKSIFD